MRALTVVAAVTFVVGVQSMASASAVNRAILRKNNDAGASSTVIQKDEPPVTGMPTPRYRGRVNAHGAP